MLLLALKISPRKKIQRRLVEEHRLEPLEAEFHIILDDLGINGYIICDFSYFRCEALDKSITDVAAVSELVARDNNTDVV
jgi:hypothetical protein